MNLSKSALVFPGQGSQSLGMLKDYFDNKTIFSETFDEAKEILGVDFKSLIFSDKNEDLSRTEITQPLMLAANIALWRELDLNPKSFGAMAGHSLGEFAALVAGGDIEFYGALDTFLTLIHISEPTRQAENSYAVFSLKKKINLLSL